jgi:hypothetical protein
VSAADVLIYVEDPGAANFVVSLGGDLAAHGISAVFYAGGSAFAHLQALGVEAARLCNGADARALLAAHAAKLTLVGTAEDPDTFGLALVAAARDLKIASVGVVDGPMNAAHRFRGRSADPLAFSPDLVVVADAGTRDSFVDLGIASERVIACGHPQFDRIRQIRRELDVEGRPAVRRRVFSGAASAQRIAVFLAEISDGMTPALYRHAPHWTLHGRGASDRRTNVAIEEFLDASADFGFYRVLRLHPKNAESEFADVGGEFDMIDVGGLPFPQIYAADLVAGLTTFALAEAALLGRPTLSILPDPAQASWLPSIACGITSVASVRAQISPAIAVALRSPPSEAQLDVCFPGNGAQLLAQAIVGRLRM